MDEWKSGIILKCAKSKRLEKYIYKKVNKMNMLRYFSKFLIVALAVGLLIVGLTGCGGKEEVKEESAALSKEIEDVLDKKTDLVTKEIAEDPRIIKLVRESNIKNKDISLSEIKKLDERWMSTEGLDEFIRGFLTNEGAEVLVEFQDANDGYPEIFVADAKGLNVAMTNKTSDYYQADEEWWVQAYDEGRGKSFHSDIEYDESAMSEAIALYIPIMDPDTNKAIGVMKVIVDITAIKREL